MTTNRCRTRPAALTAALLALGLALSPAYAAGEGGNGSSGGGSNSGGSGGNGSNAGGLPTCPPGKIWSTKSHSCVGKKAELFTDDELTDYAFALAKAKRYQEALATLDERTGAETPKSLNYRGYVTRKLGRTDEGIGYYLQSVAMNPSYAQVREYLGEAYVIKGRVDLAAEQLTAIRAICGGTSCEYYGDLAAAIEGHAEDN